MPQCVFGGAGARTLDRNQSGAGVVEAAQLVVGQDALTSHLPLHEVALLGRWGLRLEITQSLTHLESEL